MSRKPYQPRARRPWVYTKRYSESRVTLERQRRYDIGNADCRWCGRSNHTRIQHLPFLYAFRVVSDAGRIHNVEGLYCSSSCMRIVQEGEL